MSQKNDLSDLEYLPEWYSESGPWHCNCGWDDGDGWCSLVGDCAYRFCKDAPDKREALGLPRVVE